MSIPDPPAAAVSHDPTAVIGRRIVAWFIDTAILLALSTALWVAFSEGYDNPNDLSDPCAALRDADVDAGSCLDLGGTVWVASAGEAGVISMVVAGYAALTLVIMQGLTGATPGKLVAKLRVVREDGTPPGPPKAMGRTLLLAIDWAPWIVPIVGPITAVTTVGHRRVGDMAAKTYVVGIADAGRPVVLPDGARLPGAPVPVTPQPLTPTTPPTAPGAPAAPAPAAASGDQPRWDEARHAWLTWDAARGHWLRWDEATSTWGPLDDGGERSGSSA